MTNTVGFSDIVFPVFHLGKLPPITENGLSYYLLGKNTKYDDAEYKKLIIDDKNQPETSLAMRRLSMKNKGIELKKLNKALFFMADLIKLTKLGSWFIDKEGQIFEYKKSKRVRLIFRKIIQVLPLKTGGAIIEVQGSSSRFKTLFAPNDDQKYAGLLVLGNSYILYGLYDQQYADTIRMI